MSSNSPTGAVPLIKPVIDKMKQTDFRVSDTLYAAALKQAGE
ncbi:DUF3368 domain-containing protein [Pedobacter faecalis]|nr:DUF3368 domain-containing protein [Pedobacter sp. ELA7]